MSAPTQQPIPWGSYLPYHIARDLAAHPEAALAGREQRFPAVVIFADIRGFTAISEALAAAGDQGAEELSAILNATFAPMIELIHSYGGIVGTFGGDSLSAMFPYESGLRPAAARRALFCALQLQAHLAAYHGVETIAGHFALAMRIGLASGPVLSLVVGTPETGLEYVLAGAVFDRAAEAEQCARPGEVAVHTGMLPDLGRIDLADRHDVIPRPYCVVTALHDIPTPAPLPPIPTFSIEIANLAAAFLPTPAARRLSDGQVGFINEYRNVGVLFVGFEGFDYDGDQTTAARLQAYLNQVFQVVKQFNGYVNKIDIGDKGSKLLILFGAPEAHEDDAARALHCALALRELHEFDEGRMTKDESGTAADPSAFVHRPSSYNDPSFHNDPSSVVRRPSSVVQLRIGITAGIVYSGQSGSDARREHMVIGDTVNLSARLMQAARPAQILVAESARRAAGASFAWEPAQELSVKGRANPVRVAALAGVAGLAGEELPQQIIARVLFGREAELDNLRAANSNLFAGQGRLLLLVGEAGLGKTALIGQAASEAARDGAQILYGECLAYRGSTGYLVWHEPLRRLLGLRPTMSAEQIRAQIEESLAAIDPRMLVRMALLGPALGLSLPDNELTASMESERRKATLEQMLTDIVAYYARRRPLLIALDSCQWIDPLALDLLETLARRAAGLPLLLLVGLRESDDDSRLLSRLAQLPSGSRLDLTQLSPDATRQLTIAQIEKIYAEKPIDTGENTAGSRIQPELLSRLVERADGNPLFIEELSALLHSRKIDPADPAAAAALDLPANLHSLVLSRIDQLDEEAQTTLKVASVIGQSFTPDLLAGICPDLGDGRRLDAQLQELQRNDIAVSGDSLGSYLFKHMFTREVVYQSLARSTRADLHARAGAYIEHTYADDIERHLGLLAHHYGLSDNQLKQREYFWRAGLAAQAGFANETAIELFTHLLPLLHRHERSEILMRLGQLLRHVGQWEEAAARYDEALVLTPDLSGTARCRLLQGELLFRRGELSAAREILARSRDEFAACGDRSGESDAAEQLGLIGLSQGNYTHALRAFEQALERAERIGDRDRMSKALNNLGAVFWSTGDLDRALDCFERCLRLAAELGNRQRVGVAVGNLGGIFHLRGDYGRALDCYSQKLQCALEIGDRLETSISIGNLGHIYEDQGEYRRATSCYLRSLEQALDLGDRTGVGTALLGLGKVAAAQGGMIEAEDLLGQAEQIFAMMDAIAELCECRFAQAALAIRRNDKLLARPLLAEAQVLAEASGQDDVARTCQILALEVEHALGRLSTAAAVAELRALLYTRHSDEERATVRYAIVRIDGTRAEDRAAAARLFRELHARTPRAEYRLGYADLMGVALPPPPPLPPLPAIVDERSLNRAMLLDRAGIFCVSLDAEHIDAP